MSDTFEGVWRRAHLEVSAVPALLVRAWAQEAFNLLADTWSWSYLRAEGTLVTQASRSVTMTVTNGSTTVTSSTNSFLSTDAGRQIRINRLPIYTIKSFTNAGSVELDRAYTEDSGTDVTGTVQDVYATLPADFRRFLVIYDRYYLRILPFWMTEDDLALADPGHVFDDAGPRYLVARNYSTATATLGQVRYEYWPPPTAARTYPFLYVKRAYALADSDTLPGVLSERADLLKTYIRWQAAEWPGTTDLKNPAFNLAAAQRFKERWEADLQIVSLRDDDEYPQQLAIINWARRVGSVAPTATLLRQTDATVADYY